ncbi:MAG: M28 family metallopeptidase [Chloroflexota bacterium]
MRVDRERLWGHLRALCEEIGPRLSGTAGDERAVEYIAGHFRRCGALVEVQDFPCPSWEHEATELALLAEHGPLPLSAVAQTFSLGCDVEAQLAAVDTWQALDLAPDLEGKVLLLSGDVARGLAPDRNPVLLSVEERRAKAVIVASPAETVSTKLIRDPFLTVPAVAVPHAVGQQLRQRVGARVRLQIRARRYGSTGHNVIGRLPGRRGERERIAVAAHYDTAAGVPGATDNASGTAAVLELCEVFAAAGVPALGIDFVAFGADEYGRHRGGNLGAAEYVRRHPVEVGKTRAVVEADGVGTAPRRPRVRLIGWPPGRRESLLEVLRRFPAYTVDDQSDKPDARPTAFHLPGVPALAFVDDYRFLPIHTVQDTIDLMSPDGLALAAEVMGAVVEHLSASPSGEGGR